MGIHPRGAEKEFSAIAILFDENFRQKRYQDRAGFEYFLNEQSKIQFVAIRHFWLPTSQPVFPFCIPV